MWLIFYYSIGIKNELISRLENYFLSNPQKESNSTICDKEVKTDKENINQDVNKRVVDIDIANEESAIMKKRKLIDSAAQNKWLDWKLDLSP